MPASQSYEHRATVKTVDGSNYTQPWTEHTEVVKTQVKTYRSHAKVHGGGTVEIQKRAVGPIEIVESIPVEGT